MEQSEHSVLGHLLSLDAQSLQAISQDLTGHFGLKHSKATTLGVETLCPVETNRKVSGPMV